MNNMSFSGGPHVDVKLSCFFGKKKQVEIIKEKIKQENKST